MARRSEQKSAEAAQEAGSAAQEIQAAEPVQAVEPASEPEQPKRRPDKVDQDAPKPQRQISDHQTAMNEIEENRARIEKDQISAVKAEPDPEPAPEPAKEPVVEPVAESLADLEPTDAQPAPELVKTVRVKVDGQEFDAPQDDVDAAGGVASYQRDKASENRLAKANQALAETRQLQQMIFQHAQQNAAPQQKPATRNELMAQATAARFGTDEEYTLAMNNLLESGRVDVNAITSNAVSTMQKNIAVDNFKKEFQDIVADPLLLRLAASLENERASTGHPEDWNVFFRKIGNEVRSVTGRQSQPNLTAVAKDTTSGNTSQSPSEKEARKASIVNLPTAAARAAMPESKPETREDILNQLRKSRGIPVG